MRILYIYLKIINLCLTDINIYPKNNKTDLIEIFKKKKVFKKLVFSSRIRIYIKTKRIRNTGYKYHYHDMDPFCEKITPDPT